MLDEKLFWRIIGSFAWQYAGDDDAVLEPAIQRLTRMKRADIEAFEERLAWALHHLDTREHAKYIGEGAYEEGCEYFLVDSFLYARCLVVAKGQESYETVLADPSQMPKNDEFESLLYLGALAYERKTGHEFDYDTAISYETFAHTKGWE